MAKPVTWTAWMLLLGFTACSADPETFLAYSQRRTSVHGVADPTRALARADALALNYGNAVESIFRSRSTAARYSREASDTALAGLSAFAGASESLSLSASALSGMEGWGKTRHGWYLGFFSGAFRKANFAKDALGQALKIGSVAVDKSEIPFKRKLTLSDLPGDWGKAVYTAVDVGGAINDKHIDVYCGEDSEAEKLTKKLTIKLGGSKFPKGARVCFA